MKQKSKHTNSHGADVNKKGVPISSASKQHAIDKNDLKHRLIRMIPGGAIVVALTFTVLIVMWIKEWVESSDDKPKKIVQQITIIAPPPPPPPPPEDQPPEPEVEEEVDIPEEDIAEDIPEDTSEPVGADLGVDGEGSGNGDGFGLVGKKGGRGLLDGSPFAYYEGLMVSEIQDLLANIEELKSEEYRFRIKIKVSFDGSVESVKMISSTGDKEKDRMLVAVLTGFDRFSRMPPGKMPPVVDLRITSSI